MPYKGNQNIPRNWRSSNESKIGSVLASQTLLVTLHDYLKFTWATLKKDAFDQIGGADYEQCIIFDKFELYHG